MSRTSAKYLSVLEATRGSLTERREWAYVDHKALSMYLHRKARALYLRFLPFHSPNSMDDTQTVLEKDHEGPTGAGAGNVEDVGHVTASRTILSAAEDTSESVR